MMTFLGLCHAFLSHKGGLRDESKELLHGLDITIGVLIYPSFQTCVARVKTGEAGREKEGCIFLSLPFPFCTCRLNLFRLVCVLTIVIYNKGSDVRICSVIICLLLSDFVMITMVAVRKIETGRTH